MKILRIIARLNVGGPARHVVWLTKGLSDDLHESVLVTGSVPDNEDSLEWFADETGIVPIKIEEMSRELSFSDIWSLIKILRVIRREKPDIIHTHTAKAGTLGRVAGFVYRLTTGKRVGLVHTYHGHVFHGYYGPLKTRIFLFIERMLARFATDRIIAISELQRKEINEKFKVGRHSQFAVIRLGLDIEKLRTNSEGTSSDILNWFPENAFLIGFSGRLTEIKNIGMLLRAVKELQLRGRSNVGLLIVGDGHLRDELMSESERLGVDSVVRFMGTVKDPSELIGRVDCVALTSLNEGTPLSLLEAMAIGKTVVSTEVGGVPDILGQEISQIGNVAVRKHGLGVPSEDVSALASAIELLMDDSDLKARLGTDAARFVKESYSKERLISDVRDLYSDLIK
jgi:glycosyltransferase involved in cell wall biosynthesis